MNLFQVTRRAITYLEEFLVAGAAIEDLLDEDFLIGVRELEAQIDALE